MARRNNQELSFPALSIEGGLLAPDFLNKIAHLDVNEQTEADYDIPRGLKLRDEIGRYWKIAQNLWQDFAIKRSRTDLNAHAVTVKELLEPLFHHVFGFGDLKFIGQVTLGERIFPIGLAAIEGSVPVVLAAHDQRLDRPDIRFGDGVRRRSPFLLAQEYLNAGSGALWAIVSNGLKLRILRDNPSFTRPAYIEADLEAIFTEGLYPDFTALWLLTHASRFGKIGGKPADCPLERWRNTAQEDGIRARDRLRIGVTEALRSLGTGFAAHPANGELRCRIETGELTTQAYFEQLLRLIYRFIFLATIEDRELVFAPEATADAKARYLGGYSLTRLRQLAARRRSYDRHADLWQVLTITFAGLGKGQPALGLPPLGGLFASEQCPDLDASQLDNNSLLSALFSLCFFRDGAALSRVNYRDMDSEELGSVYESLLELVPNLTLSAGMRCFGFIGDEEEGSSRGNARKLTGSYYTPDSLVQELIKSALEPVIEHTIADNAQEPVKALLTLSVCDPACGSGHFLLAAARRIAEEVARLNAIDGNPLPADYRRALRDVVAHCIYGVDKNPMAVELARTALWLEAYTPERPLTFLDAHLRCGDALLGVLDPKVLENGIPEEAYAVLSGDDKEVAKRLKAENRIALKSLKKLQGADLFADKQTTSAFAELEQLPDDTLDAIEEKRRLWLTSLHTEESSPAARLADTFVAAFLMPKTAEHQGHIPLSGYFWQLSQSQTGDADSAIQDAATQYCRTHQVFHWWLAFPHIHARGGFDVLLGNPPWERIKLQEEEFFASRSPLVAEAPHKAERGRRIALLAEGMLLHTVYPEVEAVKGLVPPNAAEQTLYAEFLAAKRGAEAASLFAHDAGRYPLTGVGDVNTYALFAETFAQLVSAHGRAGFIVPSGIGTDDSTKRYFQFLVGEQMLSSFYGFDNARRIFPAVHPDTPFALVTIGKTDRPAELGHYLLSVEHLADLRRCFTLAPQEFALINPNTLTCPVFRSERDAELTKKLYRNAPVLIAEGPPERNPWGIRFMRQIDMANDSHLFADSPEPGRMPLYEAKMIHQFDHRWATYVEAPDKPNGLDIEDCTIEQKGNASFTVRPRYWVDEKEVLARIANVPAKVARAWLAEDTEGLGLAVAEWVAATLVLQALPIALDTLDGQASAWLPAVQQAESGMQSTWPAWYARLRTKGTTGKKALTEWPKWARQQADCALSETEQAELLALRDESELITLLDIWMDRRSPRWLMGWRDITNATNERTVIAGLIPRLGVGNKMPLFLFGPRIEPQQAAAFYGNLAALSFDFVARQKIGGTTLNYFYLKQFPVLPPERYTDADLAFIVPRVLELTYTAHDLAAWAADLGYTGAPFAWNPERRAILRAELDAYYARLYGLTRDELRYILDPADVLGEDYPSETFRVLKTSEMREFGEYRTRRFVLEAWDRLEAGSSEVMVPVLSEQGIISHVDEADFAGIVIEVIRQHPEGISAGDLQTLIAYATQPSMVVQLVDQPSAGRLTTLMSLVCRIDAAAAIQLIPDVLHRLHTTAACRSTKRGDAVVYVGSTGILPADVRCSQEHTELGALLLALDARRMAIARPDRDQIKNPTVQRGAA
jgi:hypothetical protein